MNRFLSLSCLSAALILLTGACTRSDRKTASAAEADSASVDSATVTKELQRLPDTVFASVDAIKWNVSTADDAGDGHLNSLTDLYVDAPGHMTFRNSACRSADFGGTVKGRPTTIEVDWSFRTDFRGTWGGGSGWNGQPVYVNWPDSLVSRFKMSSAVRLTDDFSNREIIVGSLAGIVYFINFDTGNASRQPIDITNPIKGSVSLDPTLNGNLYVGEGIPSKRPFGALVIDLFSHSVSHTFGEDPRAPRHWGAYDSSALRVGQFLIRPAENGSLYKFEVMPGSLKLHSVLRYTFNGAGPGMESSIAVYRNYGYIGDNHGNILCVNLDTMKPVWRYFIGDDTDASPVVQEEDGRAVVYTACEVDRTDGVGALARLCKLDALTGELIWANETPARMAVVNEKHFDGGYYATPLPGTGNCREMIFVSRVLNSRGNNGEFVAVDRRTGKEIYRTPLKYYGWSSPVGFMNEAGEMFVFAADCSGNVYLIDGKNGQIIYTARVGDNFESSPVVVGNSLVVGSRGDKIFKMTVK